MRVAHIGGGWVGRVKEAQPVGLNIRYVCDQITINGVPIVGLKRGNDLLTECRELQAPPINLIPELPIRG